MDCPLMNYIFFLAPSIAQQLVCYLKSHTVWLGRICLRCDQLAGLCMVSGMVLLELHGVAAWCGVETV